MVTHRVYNKQLSDTLHARFTYENSPVSAGSDEFCLLLRLKYTGNNSEVKSSGVEKATAESSKRVATEDEAVKTSETQESLSSFSSRFSTQLSNVTRSLFLQTLDDSKKNTSKPEIKQRKESLFLGYCQLLGHYSINENIIDYSAFKDLQKNTIIEGKYAGIHGLVAPSDNSDENDSLLTGLNYLYNSELNSLSNPNIAEKMRFIPFFSSDQSIIFSELEVDPDSMDNSSEDIASFLITCKLPQYLPPSYMTESVQINYNFVFGYQMMDGMNVKSKTIFVPLKIQPYIDNYSRQPIYHLDQLNLNVKLERFMCQDVSKHPSLTRRPHFDDTVSDSRRVSFWNLKRNSASTDSPQCNLETANKGTHIESISKNTKLDNDVEHFLKTLENLNKADINDIIKVQEEFEKEQNGLRPLKFSVRENLMQILTDSKFLSKHNVQDSDFDSDTEYEQLLPKEQQAKFIIKQNHDCIATIKLNKGVFKLGDLINMGISFEQEDYATTGVEVQLLKHQILQSDYIKKGAYDEIPSRLNENVLETILFQKMLNTLNTTSINTDVLIPLETEPQFKTNFFTCKYYIQVRFITTTRRSLAKMAPETTDPESRESLDLKRKNNFFKNIFIDSNGSMLFRAKERMVNANEFYIRIPIVVLSTYEQDFGFITTKM